MSIASKYNRGKKFNFEIPKEFSYASLADLYNNNGEDYVYTVKAIYKNRKSKFGESYVVVTTHELVNVPKHVNETCMAILLDMNAVDAINNDVFGFKIRMYEYNGITRYTLYWVDM